MMEDLESIDRSYVEAMVNLPEGVILGKARLETMNKRIGDRLHVTAFGGYKDIDLTRVSTVPTPQSTELTVNILGLTVPLFNLIVGIGVLVIAVFALYIFLKYRKKASDKLEVVG
jgi:hypothetical protein